MNTTQYKKMFYGLIIISGLLLIPGFILLKALPTGIIIIIFAFLAMFSAFIELKKFYEFERIKKDFTTENLAKFAEEVKHYSNGKKE